MHSKSLFLVIGVLAAPCLLATDFVSAQATGDYRSKASGYWDVLNTWERYNGSTWVDQNPSGAIPNAANFVTIQASYPVTVRSSAPNQYADHLQVDGNLTIDSNCVLELDGSGNSTSNIASGKTLTVSGTLSFVDLDQVLSGVGKVVMNNGVIQVARHAQVNRSHQLTNQSIIEGDGVMQGFGAGSGTATFLNKGTSNIGEGVVRAVSGTLQLDASLLLADGSGVYLPLFEAGASGTLQFDSGNGSMVGDFSAVDCPSTLVFNQSIATTGNLTWSGTIIIASTKTFDAGNISVMTAGTYVSDDCDD